MSCVEKLKLLWMLVYKHIVFCGVFVTNMIACEGRSLCITAILWYILSVFHQTELQQKQSLKLRLENYILYHCFCFMFSGFLLISSFIKSIVFRRAHEFLKASRMSPINSCPFLPFKQYKQLFHNVWANFCLDDVLESCLYACLNS